MKILRRQTLTYSFGLFNEITFSKEGGWEQVCQSFKPWKDNDYIPMDIEEVLEAFKLKVTSVKVEDVMLIDRR